MTEVTPRSSIPAASSRCGNQEEVGTVSLIFNREIWPLGITDSTLSLVNCLSLLFAKQE